MTSSCDSLFQRDKVHAPARRTCQFSPDPILLVGIRQADRHVEVRFRHRSPRARRSEQERKANRTPGSFSKNARNALTVSSVSVIDGMMRQGITHGKCEMHVPRKLHGQLSESSGHYSRAICCRFSMLHVTGHEIWQETKRPSFRRLILFRIARVTCWILHGLSTWPRVGSSLRVRAE